MFYLKIILLIYAILYPIITGLYVANHLAKDITDDRYIFVYYQVLAFLSGWFIVPFMAIVGAYRLSKKESK